MKITKELYLRWTASNAKKRKKSRTLKEVNDHIKGLRRVRSWENPNLGDILGRNGTPHERLARKKQLEEWQKEKDRIAEVEAKEKALVEQINKTLKLAAREARKLGFEVKKSTDRQGRVSSYYAKRSNMKPIRISDHRLPETDHRDMMRSLHGGASPFADEIIIDQKLSSTRIRRLIVLAEQGRAWPHI